MEQSIENYYIKTHIGELKYIKDLSEFELKIFIKILSKALEDYDTKNLNPQFLFSTICKVEHEYLKEVLEKLNKYYDEKFKPNDLKVGDVIYLKMMLKNQSLW